MAKNGGQWTPERRAAASRRAKRDGEAHKLALYVQALAVMTGATGKTWESAFSAVCRALHHASVASERRIDEQRQREAELWLREQLATLDTGEAGPTC